MEARWGFGGTGTSGVYHLWELGKEGFRLQLYLAFEPGNMGFMFHILVTGEILAYLFARHRNPFKEAKALEGNI